jgi:serine/threonine protein phosphatase 1
MVRWANPFRNAFEKSSPLPITRRIPDGTRVYCVGDLHGRDDLLQQMAERVQADVGARSSDQVVTIFLGDYIDRGLGSMRVVDQLARGEWPTPMISLAGNHEHLLIGFLEDERVLEAWRGLGGLETLHSYGVNVAPAVVGRDFKAVQAAFATRLPESHMRFLKTLPISKTIGDYFFCHAGIRPGVALESQARDDLLNIREPFLSSTAEHGKLVVHGHTPSVAPEIHPNRIGIDTAAYATGRLTCLVMQEDERRFLNVGYDLPRDFSQRGRNGRLSSRPPGGPF